MGAEKSHNGLRDPGILAMKHTPMLKASESRKQIITLSLRPENLGSLWCRSQSSESWCSPCPGQERTEEGGPHCHVLLSLRLQLIGWCLTALRFDLPTCSMTRGQLPSQTHLETLLYWFSGLPSSSPSAPEMPSPHSTLDGSFSFLAFLL